MANLRNTYNIGFQLENPLPKKWTVEELEKIANGDPEKNLTPKQYEQYMNYQNDSHLYGGKIGTKKQGVIGLPELTVDDNQYRGNSRYPNDPTRTLTTGTGQAMVDSKGNVITFNRKSTDTQIPNEGQVDMNAEGTIANMGNVLKPGLTTTTPTANTNTFNPWEGDNLAKMIFMGQALSQIPALTQGNYLLDAFPYATVRVPQSVSAVASKMEAANRAEGTAYSIGARMANYGLGNQMPAVQANIATQRGTMDNQIATTENARINAQEEANTTALNQTEANRKAAELSRLQTQLQVNAGAQGQKAEALSNIMQAGTNAINYKTKKQQEDEYRFMQTVAKIMEQFSSPPVR